MVLDWDFSILVRFKSTFHWDKKIDTVKRKEAPTRSRFNKFHTNQYIIRRKKNPWSIFFTSASFDKHKMSSFQFTCFQCLLPHPTSNLIFAIRCLSFHVQSVIVITKTLILKNNGTQYFFLPYPNQAHAITLYLFKFYQRD